MSGYPENPRGLLKTRYQWLLAREFSSVYHSYHPDSAFRSHFRSEKEYIAFAEAQKLDTLHLVDFVVVAESQRGRLAKLLTYQNLQKDDTCEHYLEITSLRHHDGHWKVLAAKRRLCAEKPVLSEIDWGDVEQHPETVVF